MSHNSFFNKLTDVCHDLLKSDERTLGYLTNERNIDKNTLKKYKIGYFPRDLRLLFDRVKVEDLVDNKIVWDAYNSPFKYGRTPIVHYPVVIPVNDAHGRSVAIGCRTLLSERLRKRLGVPKYKNSEFSKGAYLFGLDKAIDEIRNSDCVFVTEGYFDAISCHKIGVMNVVATCGTAFTKRQMIVLSRYTNNIVLLFDNDNAGKVSSEKIVRKLNEDDLIDVNLRCKIVPDGYKDIDEYINKGPKIGNFFKL